MNNHKLTTVLQKVIEGQAVSDYEWQIARNQMKAMLLDAKDYGLSEAEVVKAVLAPTWEPPAKCGCPQCSFRRHSSEDVSSNEAAL